MLLPRARFQALFRLATLELCNQPRHRNLFACFTRSNEIDQLPVRMRLERGEGRHEIDRFQQAGFALGVTTYQNDNPPGHVQIQASEIAEIGQRQVIEIHVTATGIPVRSRHGEGYHSSRSGK